MSKSKDVETPTTATLSGPSVRIAKGSEGLRVSSLLRQLDGEATPEHVLSARLAAADTDGDGVLDHKEVVAVFKDLLHEEVGKRNWRRTALWTGGIGLLLMLGLVAAVVGLTAVVIDKTKDTKTTNNYFVDKDSGKILGTAGSQKVAFDFNAPAEQLSSISSFVLDLGGNQIALKVDGVVRTPAYAGAAGSQGSPARMTLYTPAGKLVLTEAMVHDPSALRSALEQLGLELAPAPIDPEGAVADGDGSSGGTGGRSSSGGRRRALGGQTPLDPSLIPVSDPHTTIISAYCVTGGGSSGSCRKARGSKQFKDAARLQVWNCKWEFSDSGDFLPQKEKCTQAAEVIFTVDLTLDKTPTTSEF